MRYRDFIVLEMGYVGPIGSSRPVFKLRIVNLLRECQKIFHSTALTTMIAKASAMLPRNSANEI